MIKLGDRRSVHPVTFDPGQTKEGKQKTATGRVVYVHPKGRFCTLEFEIGARSGATIRERFQLVEGEIFQ